jgi:hypothetical protein
MGAPPRDFETRLWSPWAPVILLSLEVTLTVPCEDLFVRTKTLMACVELGRTLSHKVNPDAFLFKVTKGS